MDRRSFLKTIGLGAVALTVPKPLSVIAAKMADLERPPLHVGYSESEPAHGCGPGGFFALHNIGVCTEPGISMARYEDYAAKWCISMFLRPGGVAPVGRGIRWLTIPAYAMPNPENKVRATDEDGKEYQTCDFFKSPKALMLMPGDVTEFWFAPRNVSNPEALPLFPLPKLEVVLHGVKHCNDGPQAKPSTGREYVIGTRALSYWHLGRVESVLLDRARAIELGLVSPATLEFDAG